MGIDKERNSGEPNDRVKIRLGSTDDLRTAESYSFHSSVLQQPDAFSLTLSGGKGAAGVLKKYPPGPKSPCGLFIGPYQQFTGELDAPDAHGDANSTLVDLKGRSLMSRLQSADILGEQSFNNVSYEDLVKAALAAVGLSGRLVKITNKKDVELRSGAKVTVLKEPVTTDEVTQIATGSNNKYRNVVTAKMGETWLDFLHRHLRKVGLFLWNDAGGNFVLSRPNGDQAPTFHFYRRRGQGTSVSNVKSFQFSNDTTHRFSEVVIFARNYGRKHGHNHTNGGFVDEEMKALGFDRKRVYRDVDVSTPEEAEHFARREIAEVNRAAWHLQYVISGHSAPLLDALDKRAVVCPDMVARVDDDELNIHQNLYIESVEYRSPPRTTVITMMRPQDLVFGEKQAVAGAQKAKDAAKQAEQVRTRQIVSFERDKPNEQTNLFQTFIANVPKSPLG